MVCLQTPLCSSQAPPAQLRTRSGPQLSGTQSGGWRWGRIFPQAEKEVSCDGQEGKERAQGKRPLLSKRTYYVLASCWERLQSRYLQNSTCKPELITVKYKAFCMDAWLASIWILGFLPWKSPHPHQCITNLVLLLRRKEAKYKKTQPPRVKDWTSNGNTNWQTRERRKQRRHFSVNDDAVAQESFGTMLLSYQSTPASLPLDQRSCLPHARCLVCPGWPQIANPCLSARTWRWYL